MAKFNFPKSIKSRPVYGTLEPRVGNMHLFVSDADGADAIFDLVAIDVALMAKSHIVYIPQTFDPTGLGDDKTRMLRSLAPLHLKICPSYSASVQHLRRTLENAHMGVQVYLAGTEGLIGQAMREVVNAGFPHEAIQTEHRGSVARRMQCVHCKGITENVITDPFVCSHCGLHLFVRDHYSRRLAAFQGVRVDAEDPGNVPQPVGLYS
ncbi:MAG: dimethylamine monooxygenase subunit DmmA family protein [Rhodobacterales bacterium]